MPLGKVYTWLAPLLVGEVSFWTAQRWWRSWGRDSLLTYNSGKAVGPKWAWPAAPGLATHPPAHWCSPESWRGVERERHSPLQTAREPNIWILNPLVETKGLRIQAARISTIGSLRSTVCGGYLQLLWHRSKSWSFLISAESAEGLSWN